MNWPDFYNSIKNRLRGRLKKSKVTPDIRSDRIKDFTLSIAVTSPEYFPEEEIRKVIAFNPWTVVSSPPVIQIVKDKNAQTKVDIRFGIIDLKEGETIEKDILDLLQDV